MSYSFDVLEGRYQSHNSEPCAPDKLYQMNQFGVANVPVRMSFLDFPDSRGSSGNLSLSANDANTFCINIGNELRLYSQSNSNLSSDQRSHLGSPSQIRFKTTPTTHSFRHATDSAHDSHLVIGLVNGEIKVIDPFKEDTIKTFNEGKSVDDTPVTCIGWVPHSPFQFLVSHSSGYMYLYDERFTSLSTPSYTLFKQGIGFSVFTCKTKSTRNPLYRWVLGNHVGVNLQANVKTLLRGTSHSFNGYNTSRLNETAVSDNGIVKLSSKISSLFEENNVSINHFSFSPCGRFLAIVTDDGYLRVMEYHEMELYGFMRSYFGALLCVDWSPDSLYIVTGGQDDLITIWSVVERAVICRGQGHKSWVSMVRFDPFLCPLNRNTLIRNDHNLHQNSSMAMGLEDNSPDQSTLCENQTVRTYRLGSVGHDTMLCLWDLTDDIIRQGAKFIQSTIASYEPSPCSSALMDSFQSHLSNLPAASFGPLSTCDLSVQTTAPLSGPDKDSASSSSGLPSPGEQDIKTYVSMGNPDFSKGNSSAKLTNNHFMNSASSSNSAASSGSEKAKSILTFPRSLHWHHSRASTLSGGMRFPRLVGTNKLNTSGHNTNPSYKRLMETKWILGVSRQNVLGSPLCPRIDDVPLLEPIICTRILKDRVTDLVFRKGAIHVVDQQGLFLAWERPAEVGDCRSLLNHSETDRSAE